MDFDSSCKVIIDTLNIWEAEAFIKFLRSEVFRHQRDIDDAEALIIKVIQKFNHNEPLAEKTAVPESSPSVPKTMYGYVGPGQA